MEPLHLPLHQLTEDSCRWPYGDGPFTFCGRSKQGNRSYCPGHHFMAHQKGTQKDVDHQASAAMGKVGAGGRMLAPGVW